MFIQMKVFDKLVIKYCKCLLSCSSVHLTPLRMLRSQKSIVWRFSKRYLPRFNKVLVRRCSSFFYLHQQVYHTTYKPNLSLLRFRIWRKNLVLIAFYTKMLLFKPSTSEIRHRITDSLPGGSAHVTADTGRILHSTVPHRSHCTRSPGRKEATNWFLVCW